MSREIELTFAISTSDNVIDKQYSKKYTSTNDGFLKGTGDATASMAVIGLNGLDEDEALLVVINLGTTAGETLTVEQTSGDGGFQTIDAGRFGLVHMTSGNAPRIQSSTGTIPYEYYVLEN